MIKQLIKLANHLDKKGLQKEADYLDRVISKLAQEDVSRHPDYSSVDKRENELEEEGYSAYVQLDEDMETFQDHDISQIGPDGTYLPKDHPLRAKSGPQQKRLMQSFETHEFGESNVDLDGDLKRDSDR